MDRINRSLESISEDIDLGLNWRQRVLVIGGIVGAVLGVASAYFYIRAAEENNMEGESPQPPEAGDAVKLGLSLLTIMRTIAEWGTRNQ